MLLTKDSGIVGVFLPGIIFGVIISFYFYKQPIYKIVTFIIISGAAYFLAYFIASLIGGCAVCGFTPAYVEAGWLGIARPGMLQLAIANLAGGAVGALMVSIAYKIFVPHPPRIYGGIFDLTLIGGVLAVVGFLPGLFLGSTYENNYIQSFYILFPVWQFGMAFALSRYMGKEKNSEAAENIPPRLDTEGNHIELMH